MKIDRKFFYDYVRLNLFDGAMKKPQVGGVDAILDKWEAEHTGEDIRWLAYMLGTAHHETGRTMQPVRETFATSDAQAISRLNGAFAAGKLTWVKKAYWTPDAEGKSWLGRGFVQITHKANYAKLGQVTGIDLLADPTRAMDLHVALAIMFQGMIRGAFTGKGLRDYFSGPTARWPEARAIINGVERRDLVASYAKRYNAAITLYPG